MRILEIKNGKIKIRIVKNIPMDRRLPSDYWVVSGKESRELHEGFTWDNPNEGIDW